MQAKADIEDLPIGSADYEAAAAFLTSPSAYWQRARSEIAAHLSIHGDDIRRGGQRGVVTRRRAGGRADVEPPRAGVAETVAPMPMVREPLVVPAMLRAALGYHRTTGPSAHRVRA